MLADMAATACSPISVNRESDKAIFLPVSPLSYVIRRTMTAAAGCLWALIHRIFGGRTERYFRQKIPDFYFCQLGPVDTVLAWHRSPSTSMGALATESFIIVLAMGCMRPDL
jgi:hypothetical protein